MYQQTHLYFYYRETITDMAKHEVIVTVAMDNIYEIRDGTPRSRSCKC
jgi:hypothetical protein